MCYNRYIIRNRNLVSNKAWTSVEVEEKKLKEFEKKTWFLISNVL